MKKWPYFAAMVVFTVLYVAGQLFGVWSELTNTVTTSIAIIAAVAFWMELKGNDKLNEAKFIMDLNNQFISNQELTAVEWELGKYYAKVVDGTLTEQDNAQLRSKYDLNNKERQHLINYLVHLEGVAAIINEDVLHLYAIQDLMAYRYFIAVNNPIIQEIELIPYKDHYRGCYKIYDTWGMPKDKIPMSENSLVKN